MRPDENPGAARASTMRSWLVGRGVTTAVATQLLLTNRTRRANAQALRRYFQGLRRA
jgi:hypothetical protein